MKKLLSLLLGLCLLLCSAALAEELPQEDYYGRYMAARTEEERQAVLAEMPDTRYPAYDAKVMKWGFIDRVGRWVVEPQWDDMAAFAHGRYALVNELRADDSIANSIIDGNGELVVRLPDGDFFHELRYSETSDFIAIDHFDINTEWYFDANTGKLLNEAGFVSGNAEVGYIVDRYFNEDVMIGYLLDSQGNRLDEGLWFDASIRLFTPADDPDAPLMHCVYWNRALWEETIENDPTVLELCGDDLSWVDTRPEGYSLIAKDGSIVCTAESEDEFLRHEYKDPETYVDCARCTAISAGLAWKDNYPEDADTIYLMDQAGNEHYSICMEEWELHHGADEDLQPSDDIFLVWNRNFQYGYLNGNGSVLYPLQFDYAAPFTDGLASVTWYDEYDLIPYWNWSEEQWNQFCDCLYTDPVIFASIPHEHCYIDAFGHVVYTYDNLPRRILTQEEADQLSPIHY